MSAAAGGHSDNWVPKHRPIACKMGGGSGLELEIGCGFKGIAGTASGDPTGWVWGYDRSMYTDTKDFSPWEVLNNTKLFPSSDSGYNCTPTSTGSNLCARSTAEAPHAGIDNASLSQLKIQANRGSVLSWVEDDTLSCTTTSGCFKTTVVFPKYTAEALYTYTSAGEVNVPQVSWYKNDGKGIGGLGTYIGTSRGFLTSADPDTAIEPANSVTASSTVSPDAVVTKGGRLNYSATAWANTSGSTLVRLQLGGVGQPDESSIPRNWVKLPNSDKHALSYLIPHMNAGDVVTVPMHFTVEGYTGVGITAFINDASTRAEVAVTPEAPVCTTPDSADGHPVAIAGSKPTVLAGLHCAVASDSSLEVFVPVGRDIKKLSISDDTVRYVPPTTDFHGEETVYVLARNEGGIASAPTAITVNVVDKAAPVDDEFTVQVETRTTLDAEHGLMANDTFPGGTAGWFVLSEGVEADGAIRIGEHGELTIEPGRHFTGDLTFQYKLAEQRGDGTDAATVTIHVVE
ncbi:hypothetical protein B7R22_00955 [Subtercola boreus]|uniref:Uncharacterized protein n=2 Tax=Subtercola boreus TaxID=120213 RepID=A0A3E0W6X7_9MICO|nr:hypothetical protein B7R22_00955 [Subtercola boreus]